MSQSSGSRVARIRRALVGEFHYKPPGWMPKFARAADDHLRVNPGRYASLILVIGIGFLAVPKLLEWQRAHQPRERQLTEKRQASGKLTMPGVTPIVKDKPQPMPVVIDFNVSTAKLEAVGASAVGTPSTPWQRAQY